MSDWIAAIFMLSGGVFCLIAGIGIVRLGDVFCRMHAATKSGTLGLALICVAMMIKADTWLNLAEASVVFLFMIATAPVGAHLIGRAAFRNRDVMVENTTMDADCTQFRKPLKA